MMEFRLILAMTVIMGAMFGVIMVTADYPAPTVCRMELHK